jgi:diadenylate cyclase
VKSFIQSRLLHNFGLKVISLLLAVGLWLAVARDPVAEIAVEIPIEFHNLPENLEISSESVPRAQIRLRGPERAIHNLGSSDVHAEIDLSTIKPGERTFDLNYRHIRQPQELQVVQVIPSQFQLAFDARLTRHVKVQPRVIGTFPPEHTLGSVHAVPPEILISGPRRRVEAVDTAITDPVDASGVLKQSTFVTHAYVADPLIQVVNPEPIHVVVNVETVAAAPTHTAPQKPE